MKFAVHPTEFVVHMPHKESAARLMIIDPANAALRDKVGLCFECHPGMPSALGLMPFHPCPFEQQQQCVLSRPYHSRVDALPLFCVGVLYSLHVCTPDMLAGARAGPPHA